MGRIRMLSAAAGAAMMLTSASAFAQTLPDRTTFVTFSGPVSIPGATLPAGTYTFRLADSPSNLHIVQIFDRDQTKIYATVLAVSAERMEAEGDPVLTFKETPADRPPALRYWYYAGEKSGNEFIYPKSQAVTIARASGESVMSVDTDSSNIEEMKAGKTSRVTADTAATTTTTDKSATEPATPPTEPAPQAAPTTPPAAPPAAEPTRVPSTEHPVGTSGREATELPRTASEVPLIGLLGVLSLAAALSLRLARRANG